MRLYLTFEVFVINISVPCTVPKINKFLRIEGYAKQICMVYSVKCKAYRHFQFIISLPPFLIGSNLDIFLASLFSSVRLKQFDIFSHFPFLHFTHTFKMPLTHDTFCDSYSFNTVVKVAMVHSFRL